MRLVMDRIHQEDSKGVGSTGSVVYVMQCSGKRYKTTRKRHLKNFEITIVYYRNTKKIPNYQNGRIYRIICNVTGEDYISSTTLPLCQRLAHHMQEYKQFMKGTNKHSLLHKVMDGNDFEIGNYCWKPIHAIRRRNCMQGHDIGRGDWQKRMRMMMMVRRSKFVF
jgi:hypothetical protein